jgi:hypothetical protein
MDCETEDGSAQNAEFFTIEGNEIKEVEVYFVFCTERCVEEIDLLEIGRSHLGNPGVVVGSEAHFLLQGMHLALHLRHLVA